ncbi:hypothetical protein HNR06_001862 [Nocardiopsis arvandica]|uniref:Integral membrane protein n=1 Tax=Nocardiopsis sinuspersici TaxID=501010 RepID=A0A7Y9XD02_9ACTN|nr:hypothetical protein [Nocardiopsis sinuspersici]NYH52273.1 hypothetical protein [Nocardiopsis sinuspersici]
MSDLAASLDPHEPDATAPVPRSPETSVAPPGRAGPTRGRVELRVHGVSGGQAEELLDVEPAMRVGGDRLAGFFRWRREPDTETVPGVRREIFAWGNLTSGSSSRAFWLLLLPFMLVNVAYWMRPGRMDRAPAGVRRLANNSYGAGVRLLALSLTVLIALAAAGVGMDLVAWQCASGLGEACVRARPWLAFLGSPSSPLSAPGPALVVGAVLPVAVVVVLWRLSRRTAADYEVVSGSVPPRPTAAAPLSHAEFWRNSETMARLRSAHISVALGTIAASLLLPALRHDLAPAVDGVPGGPGPWIAGTVLSALLAAVTAASTLSVLVPGADPRWNARADRICRLLRDTTLVLGLAVVAYALWPRPGWTASGRLPGDGAVLNTLFAVQVALVLVTLVAALVLFASDRAHDGTAMLGLAGPATAALGALLGGGFSAALVYQSSLLLSGCGSMATPEVDCLPLSVPTAYSWLQLAFALEAAIVLAVVAVLALKLRRDTRAHLSGVTEDYARSVRDRRTWTIAHARAVGRMTEVLPSVLGALLLPVVALGALALYSVLSRDLAADPAAAATAVSSASGEVREVAQGAVSGLIGVGSLLGGAALVALVWIGRSAYRDRPTRQAVGALWDVGTFWPRVAHPLAPPSYAERAVPQLSARVALMCREGTDVVLSGHSQGSVLAAATVWQLPTDCLGRIALLTHGSPLDRLYARYFPAYFGPGPFADLRERVSAWHNLWRVTDAIAGPVRTRAPSGEPGPPVTVEQAEPLPDPRSYDAPPGEARRPEILGHSYYTGDPAYAGTLRRVLRAMEEAEAPRGDAVGGCPPSSGA